MQTPRTLVPVTAEESRLGYSVGTCTDCEREAVVFTSPRRVLPERYAARLCAECREQMHAERDAAFASVAGLSPYA